MVDMNQIEDMLPTIEKISRNVASDYPDIDWEDVRNEVVLFLVKNKDSVKSKEEGGNPNWIFRRVAQTFCKAERVQQQILSPQYSYRPSDVAKILETAFQLEHLDKTHVPEDAESLKAGTDALDIASDVRAAYDRLPVEQKRVIFTRYALNEVPDNASYERKKVNKAVKELTRILNTYRGRANEGRRRVVSNARAQAIISGDFQ